MFRFLTIAFIYTLYAFRRALSSDGRTFLVLFTPRFQPFLAWVGKLRARVVFEKAKRRCPAYRNFLEGEKFVGNKWKFEDIPIMTKENYVKKFSLEERCFDGKIP